MAQCEATRLGHPDKNEEPRRCRRNAVRGSTFCQAHGGTEDPKALPAYPRKDTGNTVQCIATVKKTGLRCKRHAILGGTVCNKHGGKSPMVAKKARQRMEAMVGPALRQLNEILTKPDTSDSDRLRAIALLLDRCGFGPKNEVTLEVKSYEKVIATIFRDVPPELEYDIVEGEVVDGPESIEADDPEFDYSPEPEEAQTEASPRWPLVPVPPPPPMSHPNPPAYLR